MDEQIFILKDTSSGKYVSVTTLNSLESEDFSPEIHLQDRKNAVPFLGLEFANEAIRTMRQLNLAIEPVSPQEAAEFVNDQTPIDLLSDGLLDDQRDKIFKKHACLFEKIFSLANQLGIRETLGDKVDVFHLAMKTSIEFKENPYIFSEGIEKRCNEFNDLIDDESFLDSAEGSQKFVELQFLIGAEVLIEDFKQSI